jgi:hypothetical protein
MKERGKVRLPDPETLLPARWFHVEPIRQRLQLNSIQLKVRKAGLPPALKSDHSLFDWAASLMFSVDSAPWPQQGATGPEYKRHFQCCNLG